MKRIKLLWWLSRDPHTVIGFACYFLLLLCCAIIITIIGTILAYSFSSWGTMYRNFVCNGTNSTYFHPNCTEVMRCPDSISCCISDGLAIGCGLCFIVLFIIAIFISGADAVRDYRQLSFDQKNNILRWIKNGLISCIVLSLPAFIFDLPYGENLISRIVLTILFEGVAIAFIYGCYWCTKLLYRECTDYNKQIDNLLV